MLEPGQKISGHQREELQQLVRGLNVEAFSAVERAEGKAREQRLAEVLLDLVAVTSALNAAHAAGLSAELGSVEEQSEAPVTGLESMRRTADRDAGVAQVEWNVIGRRAFEARTGRVVDGRDAR